jgi:hypothetical protein
LTVSDATFQTTLAKAAGMREEYAMIPKMTANPVLMPFHKDSDRSKQLQLSRPQGGFSTSSIDLK